MNLYSYAGGNPINAIDPEGTDDYGADPSDHFDLNKYFSDIFDNHTLNDYWNATKRKINRFKYKVDHDAGAQCMGVYLSLITAPIGGGEFAGAKISSEVIEAFEGAPKFVTLTKDLTVYRYAGGSSENIGRWSTPTLYSSADKARKMLALPAGNTAAYITKFVIPKGTKILYGTVKSMVDKAEFGSHATGGGVQIYIPPSR